MEPASRSDDSDPAVDLAWDPSAEVDEPALNAGAWRPRLVDGATLWVLATSATRHEGYLVFNVLLKDTSPARSVPIFRIPERCVDPNYLHGITRSDAWRDDS